MRDMDYTLSSLGLHFAKIRKLSPGRIVNNFVVFLNIRPVGMRIVAAEYGISAKEIGVCKLGKSDGIIQSDGRIRICHSISVCVEQVGDRQGSCGRKCARRAGQRTIRYEWVSDPVRKIGIVPNYTVINPRLIIGKERSWEDMGKEMGVIPGMFGNAHILDQMHELPKPPEDVGEQDAVSVCIILIRQ